MSSSSRRRQAGADRGPGARTRARTGCSGRSAACPCDRGCRTGRSPGSRPRSGRRAATGRTRPTSRHAGSAGERGPPTSTRRRCPSAVDRAHAGDRRPAGAAPASPGHRTSFPVRTVAARYTSPGRPRAEMALATVSTSNSVRRMSAWTSPSTIDHRRPGGGRVAVEHVAGGAAVHDDLPAEVADLGDVGVAHADHARVGRRGPLEDHVGVERLVEAARLRARGRVHDEDQRVVVGADAALGGQAPEPVELLVAQLVVGPLRREPDRLGHAVLVLRERRAIVEVGDRDVGVAGHDQPRRPPPGRAGRRRPPTGPGR